MSTLEESAKAFASKYVDGIKEEVKINGTQETFIKYLLEEGFTMGAKVAIKTITSTCDKLINQDNE